jgi:hypothetical protein
MGETGNMTERQEGDGVWFDAREVPRFQEPVEEGELRVGEVYFTVSYLDEDMLVPELVPVAFLGRQLDGDDIEGMLYFQDYDSYRQGVRWAESCTEVSGVNATIFSIKSGESTDVFDYERALESLLKCSLRRRTSQTPR